MFVVTNLNELSWWTKPRESDVSWQNETCSSDQRSPRLFPRSPAMSSFNLKWKVSPLQVSFISIFYLVFIVRETMSYTRQYRRCTQYSIGRPCDTTWKCNYYCDDVSWLLLQVSTIKLLHIGCPLIAIWRALNPSARSSRNLDLCRAACFPQLRTQHCQASLAVSSSTSVYKISFLLFISTVATKNWLLGTSPPLEQTSSNQNSSPTQGHFSSADARKAFWQISLQHGLSVERNFLWNSWTAS